MGNAELEIGVAAVSRFHMFDLARELSQLNQRVTLYTGYPRWKVEEELRNLAETRPSRVMLSMLAARATRGAAANWWTRTVYKDFGMWLARKAKAAPRQILDALDGVGLEAGPVTRANGGIWFCNRGSAHPLTQRELVTAEFKRWKQPLPQTYFDPWMIDRCMGEYEGANAIITPSQFARNSFIERGHAPESVFVCPYGVDLGMFKPVKKEDNKFRVLFVGIQTLRKGIGYLFEAVRPLVEQKQIEMWLLGMPSEDGKTLLDSNADLFTHKGTQPRSQLSWYYSQASVLVLPSIEEGLALVQAQALACGIPVIATNNTGAEDLFHDGVEGFIVRPRDPGAIREKIQLLLDNPARLAEMSAAARARISHIGGWRDYGKRCLDVYRSVAGNLPAASSR